MSKPLDIGDIVRATFGLPEVALAGIPETIEEQVRPPTQEEELEIEKLAQSAATLQDEIKELLGDKAGRVQKMRAELKDRMLRHGLTEVTIAGRPPIELTSSNSRKPTRKAIMTVLQKAYVEKLGEKEGMKEGTMKALNLWNAIEQTTSYSVKIPDVTPDEVSSPY